VKLNRASDLGQYAFASGGSGHTTRQIGHIGGKAGASRFNHHGVGVGHRRSTPDCFSMLRNVPGLLQAQHRRAAQVIRENMAFARDSVHASAAEA
jgi:hypothetical protein